MQNKKPRPGTTTALLAEVTSERGGGKEEVSSRPGQSRSRRITLPDQAELISTGCLPFPTDRPATEQADLAARVQSLRRQRLIRLVARAIARDIRRHGQPTLQATN